MGNSRHELGTYRGYRLYAIEDLRRFRGYALKPTVLPDGTTSEDAFTASAPTLLLVEELLRDSIDEEGEQAGR
jgi:hypothetical protein